MLAVGGPELCLNVLHSVDVTVVLCPAPVSVSHLNSSKNALAAHFSSSLSNETAAVLEVEWDRVSSLNCLLRRVVDHI